MNTNIAPGTYIVSKSLFVFRQVVSALPTSAALLIVLYYMSNSWETLVAAIIFGFGIVIISSCMGNFNHLAITVDQDGIEGPVHGYGKENLNKRMKIQFMDISEGNMGSFWTSAKVIGDSKGNKIYIHENAVPRSSFKMLRSYINGILTNRSTGAGNV